MVELVRRGRFSPSTDKQAELNRVGLMVIGGIYVAGFLQFEAPVSVTGTAFFQSSMGAFSYCGNNCQIHHAKIGRYCSIADNVMIGPFNHPLDRISTSSALGSDHFGWFKSTKTKIEFEDHKPVLIGNDVWIGARATIMGGVTVGHGAVIATGSIVTKDVAPYMIVGGVPARHLRTRFGPELVGRLLKIEPWRYDLPGYVDQKGAHTMTLTETYLDELESLISQKKISELQSVVRRLQLNDEDAWVLRS